MSDVTAARSSWAEIAASILLSLQICRPFQHGARHESGQKLLEIPPWREILLEENRAKITCFLLNEERIVSDTDSHLHTPSQ